MTNELTTQNTINNFRAFATAARAKQQFEGTPLKFIKGEWLANEQRMYGDPPQALPSAPMEGVTAKPRQASRRDDMDGAIPF